MRTKVVAFYKNTPLPKNLESRHTRSFKGEVMFNFKEWAPRDRSLASLTWFADGWQWEMQTFRCLNWLTYLEKRGTLKLQKYLSVLNILYIPNSNPTDCSELQSDNPDKVLYLVRHPSLFPLHLPSYCVLINAVRAWKSSTSFI